MHQLKSPSLIASSGVKVLVKAAAKKALLLTAFVTTAASAQFYIGSFKVQDGPAWGTTPPVYTGLEAAALVFGGAPSDYAISVDSNTTDPGTITHTAYYSTYGGPCAIFGETASIDTGAPGYGSGDRSAYIADHCYSGQTNYVWRLFAIAPATTSSPVINDVGDSQVAISWTAPANNGSPITKYTVTGVPSGSCTTEIVAPATEPATSCTITGLTNGTPYKFTVVATNAIGDSAPSPESAEAIPLADLIFVGAAPNITLASGVVAATYSQTLQVTGGLPPYTFSVTGELPPGLELDTDTGIISGTPTTPGTYSFSVMAIDSAVQPTLALKAVHVAEQTFTIVITAAPVPQASVACTPSELTDSANQVSTCTVTLSPAPTQAISINLVLLAGSPRYSTSCVSPITIAANETTATCTITATENTVAGDGNVTAELSIAPPTVADAYSVSGSPAQVVIKDDDKPAVAAATPVPTLGGIGLLLLSGLVAGSIGVMRRRKSI